MTKPDSIARAFAAVDASLREVFPLDFHSRCMYASLGMVALLEDAGIAAQMIGGDIACAVIEKGGNRKGFQGFGLSSSGAPTHFWVETQDLLLDLGLMYLPHRSTYPLSKLPVVRWNLENHLPDYLDYREILRYAPGVQLSDATFQRCSVGFRAHCRTKAQSLSTSASLKTWELKSHMSLLNASQRGDRWAKEMLLFIKAGGKAMVPR